MTHLSRLICFSLVLLFGLMLITPILNIWNIGFNWHDQQRLYQVFILVTVSVVCLFTRPLALPKNAYTFLVMIFMLGAVSTLLAEYPLWAAKGWARYIGLLLLVLFVAHAVQEQQVTRALLYVLATVSFLNAFQFLVAYAAAFLTGL